LDNLAQGAGFSGGAEVAVLRQDRYVSLCCSWIIFHNSFLNYEFDHVLVSRLVENVCAVGRASVQNDLMCVRVGSEAFLFERVTLCRSMCDRTVSFRSRMVLERR